MQDHALSCQAAAAGVSNSHDLSCPMQETYPTLFIGLGGTGHAVLFRLRQRMLALERQAEGIRSLRQYPLAQFLLFDTDYTGEGDAKSGHEPSAASVTFSDDERVKVSNGFIDRYCRDDAALDRYPIIKSWLPVTPKWVRAWCSEAEERANQHRPTAYPRCFARLAFFDSFCSIRDALRGKLLQLRSFKGKSNRVIHRGERRVVIVSSAHGSTGSGALLDMGWLARSLGESEFEGDINTALYLTLPGGDHSNGEVEQARAYATLMELETVMRGGSEFIEQWDYHDRPTLHDRPFNDIYLVSRKNLTGAVDTSAVDIYHMIADSLFEDLNISEFSEKRRAIINCHAQYKLFPFSPPLPRKFGNISLPYFSGYSAFGLSELVYPVPMGDIVDDKVVQPRKNVLSDLCQSSRGQLFSAWLTNAMPWIDADFSVDFSPPPSAYMHLICASRSFGIDAFEEELAASIPTKAELNRRSIQITYSDRSSRVNFYSELSGFPLNCLRSLADWRASYRRVQARQLLHIHRDITKFIHPLVPSIHELEDLADDFQLFIKAVALGVLFRNPRRDVSPPGQYKFAVGPGDERNLCNERSFRMDGAPVAYRRQILEEVDDRVSRLRAPHMAALSALFLYFERHAYQPKLVTNDMGMEMQRQDFANSMAMQLSKEFRDRSLHKGAGEKDVDELIKSAYDSLSKWTTEIEGSDTDVYPWEVQLAGKGDTPRLKRVVKPEFFAADWAIPGLQESILVRSASPGLPPAILGLPPGPGVSPLLPPRSVTFNYLYHLTSGGHPYGPYPYQQVKEWLASGQVSRDIMAWREGLMQWQALNTLPEFGGLLPFFQSIPPPLPPAATPSGKGA